MNDTLNKDGFVCNPWYYYLGMKLIKKIKPCLPGQQIHIKKWQGCFMVYDVKLDYFTIKRNQKMVNVEWNEFVCVKGQGYSPEALLRKDIRNTLRSIESNYLSNTKLVDTLLKELKQLRKQ